MMMGSSTLLLRQVEAQCRTGEWLSDDVFPCYSLENGIFG
jgi:hypothetical protein